MLNATFARTWLSPLLLLLAASSLPRPGFARSPMVENAVVSAAFDESGTYRVRCRRTGWSLEGKLAGPVVSLTRRSGEDALGAWEEVDAQTPAGVAAIRVYQSEPVALFRDERTEAGPNSAVFPRFRALPGGLMKFSYGVRNFAKYEFGSLGAQGPWVLFDPERNTLVMAPADHFLAADMSDGAGGVSAGGIDPKISTLPRGFQHGTLLVIGRGITATMNEWGHALQVLGGKQPVRNDADPLLRKFGYWTDNGATYYYKFVPSLGYEGTLLAVRDAYRSLGVPIAYLQLDSWWYPKEKGNSLAAMAVNGETVYRASAEVFPDGLREFHRRMGLPLIVHARWVAANSPYRKEYRMSRDVVLSPAFWNDTARYLRDGGVTVYEQDWLNDNARPARNLTDPQEFLGNMAGAMARQDIAIQYCMPLPGYFLASTRYQNVTTIRVSNDRFQRSRWDEFLYGSALAHAVGLWPWSDVFMSGELPELILATLSAGPVGVGDPLDRIDAPNLRRAMRADSVLLKPDEPAEPLDGMFVSDAKGATAPMIAATHSGREKEVFAYAREKGETQVLVSLNELGIPGAAYEWDWVRQTGRKVVAGGSFPMVFQNGWAYSVVTPIDRNGIGLLGDANTIVPLASARFPTTSRSASAHVVVAFAAGEHAVTVTGYAAKRPAVRAIHGKVGSLHYSATTHLFRLNAHAVTHERGARWAELVISQR